MKVKQEDAERGFARNFIDQNCIVRASNGSNLLESKDGKMFYMWQFYMRQASYNPRILRYFCEQFYEKFKDDLGQFQIGGVETSSTPLIVGIQNYLHYEKGIDVNIFSIRKEKKAYGLKNWIEGYAIKDLPVVLVDDVVSHNHYTFNHGTQILDFYGIPLYNKMFVILRKQHARLPPFVSHYKQHIKVESIFNLDDFTLWGEHNVNDRIAYHVR